MDRDHDTDLTSEDLPEPPPPPAREPVPDLTSEDLADPTGEQDQ